MQTLLIRLSLLQVYTNQVHQLRTAHWFFRRDIIKKSFGSRINIVRGVRSLFHGVPENIHCRSCTSRIQRKKLDEQSHIRVCKHIRLLGNVREPIELFSSLKNLINGINQGGTNVQISLAFQACGLRSKTGQSGNNQTAFRILGFGVHRYQPVILVGFGEDCRIQAIHRLTCHLTGTVNQTGSLIRIKPLHKVADTLTCWCAVCVKTQRLQIQHPSIILGNFSRTHTLNRGIIRFIDQPFINILRIDHANKNGIFNRGNDCRINTVVRIGRKIRLIAFSQILRISQLHR